MKCPLCLKNDNSEPFSNWTYREYVVSRRKCSNCNGKYNTYEKDGNLRFTVPNYVEDLRKSKL